MDPESPAAADLLDGYGVVEVAGLLAVDRDRRQVPKVAPALAKGRGHFLGYRSRLGKCRRGERYREFVFLDDELGVDPGSPGLPMTRMILPSAGLPCRG